MQGEPGELKHLSTRRKRKKNIFWKEKTVLKDTPIDFLSSGERKGKSLNCGACTAGLRTVILPADWIVERFWESRPERVKAP